MTGPSAPTNMFQMDVMNGIIPNMPFTNSPMNQQMNMMGVGVNPMANVGQAAWQVNPMAFGQSLPVSAQPSFGFDGGQPMLEMNPVFQMGMGPGLGFGLGFDDGRSANAFMQGDGAAMWVGDPVNNQIQLVEAGLWNNPGNNINGMPMNHWGYGGGYQQ